MAVNRQNQKNFGQVRHVRAHVWSCRGKAADTHCTVSPKRRTIASRTNDVMAQTRLRQTNWNGG